MATLLQILDLLFTLLLILLILRLIFTAISSNRGHPVIALIFNLTEWVVRPFRGIVRGGNQEILAVIFALIAVLIVRVLVFAVLAIGDGRGK
ncbi:MAG: YggT family protein [Chloroflexi bacterium]|nr:YggT family protein [Chloroflexota bacterium]